MARAGFGLESLAEGAVHSSSAMQVDFPAKNAGDDPRPRVVAWGPEGDHGVFELRAASARYLDINEGGGVQSISLTATSFGETIRREDLAMRIQTELNAAAGLALTYTVYWTVAHRLRIEASGVFSILWLTGPNAATSVGREVGFDVTADDTGAAVYVADKRRYSTITCLIYDLGTATAINAVALILDGDADTDYGTSPSSLRVYGHGVALPPIPEVWRLFALTTLTPSPRPAEANNTIQLAAQASPVACRYWCVAWHHLDESAQHKVGLVALYVMTLSASRTVHELSGHALIDDGVGLGIRDYYPVQHELRWRLPLGFDEWEEADYRAVLHAAIRRGRSEPILVAVRWAGTTSILDAGVTAQAEADRGLLLWGSVVDSEGDDYSGAASAYLSGSLTLEQVR